MCGARLFCAPPCDVPTLHALRLLFALPVAPVRRRHSSPSRIFPKYPFGVGTTAFPHTPRHPFRTREARLCALSLPFFSALYCRLASTLFLASTPFSIISAGHAPFPGALSVRHSVASDSSSSLPLSPMRTPPLCCFGEYPGHQNSSSQLSLLAIIPTSVPRLHLSLLFSGIRSMLSPVAISKSYRSSTPLPFMPIIK